MNTASMTDSADLVLRGGTVLVMDEAASRATAVAVRDGVIVAVGSDAEVTLHVGPATRVIELDGRAVLPGINDSHLHASWLGARYPHTLFGEMAPGAEPGPTGALVSTDEERRTAILRASTLLAEMGITSYTEPGIGPGEDTGETGCFHSSVVEVYRALTAEGVLNQRVTLLSLYGVLDGPSNLATVVEGMRTHAALAAGTDARWLALSGVKLFGDLIPMSRQAWTERGYDDGTHGDLLVEGDTIEDRARDLAAMIREAHALGLQVGIHATGDRTIGLALDTFAEAAAEPGAASASELAHVIIHGDLATPEQVARMAELGVFMNTQSGIAAMTADWLAGLMGPEVAVDAWPLEAAMNAGVLALSSDSPVLGFDWRQGIADADARIVKVREARGTSAAVSAVDADARLHGLLRAYTAVPAAQDRASAWKGTVEAGKVADLAVLATDPFAVGAAGLPSVDIDMTVLDGAVVFERA